MYGTSATGFAVDIVLWSRIAQQLRTVVQETCLESEKNIIIFTLTVTGTIRL